MIHVRSLRIRTLDRERYAKYQMPRLATAPSLAEQASQVSRRCEKSGKRSRIGARPEGLAHIRVFTMEIKRAETKALLIREIADSRILAASWQ